MIKIKDVAYVRFGAPDLAKMERFLTDFGLVVSARRDGALYARGTDPSPYVHVTENGEAGFRGVAFEAASAEDLAAAATLEGASAVEKIDAPGGGQRVPRRRQRRRCGRSSPPSPGTPSRRVPPTRWSRART